MTLHVTLDDKLVEEAKKVGQHPDEQSAITAALMEYIIRRRQEQIVSLFGTIDYDPNYNYKLERRRS